MITQEYIDRLQTMIRKFFPDTTQKIFIFGSSLREKRFRDIDVGFLNCQNPQKLEDLKEYFEESTFPYIVDIVDFKKTSQDFSEFVLHSEKKLWI